MYRIALYKQGVKPFYYYCIIIKSRSEKVYDKIGYIRTIPIHGIDKIFITLNFSKFKYWNYKGLNLGRSNLIQNLLGLFFRI